jgi:acyl carrier protein
MITREEVDTIIFRALEALNQGGDPADHIEVSATTRLSGVGAAIDSLGFVMVISDVETALSVDYGLDVSLADYGAPSSPELSYATAETLSDYIIELVAAL